MKLILMFNLMFLTIFSFAQEKQKIQTIKTIVESNSNNFAIMGLFDDGLAADENEKTGKTPNDILIRVQRDESDLNRFIVWVDENDNGNLNDDKSFNLGNGEKKVVKISKSEKSLRSFFEISLEIRPDKSYFFWRRNQTIKGTIKIKKCTRDFYVLDLNSNGKFELGENGTGFQLDKNKDGKIWGKEEHYYSREIIDICGKNFFVSEIDENGSFVKFTPTNLQIAKIGEKSPYFNLKFLDGRNISSTELLGQKYILDFWASWCVPCVNKLPEIKGLEKKISIYYVNTDGNNRVKQAEEIVKKNALEYNSIINGLGEDDFIWKSFARINNSLPFYVVIDEKGIIVYAGNGGQELKELKGFI